MEVWTTAVLDPSNDEVVVNAFATNAAAMQSIKDNYTSVANEDPDFDIANEDGRQDMIEWLHYACGLFVFVDRHEVSR